jgi:kumamolisin
MSIANGYSKMLGLGQIGFANPGIYEIGPRTPEGGGGYNDIADGTNGDAAIYGIPGFSAGYGYDNVSGWGSPLPNLSNSFALLPLRYSSNPNPPPAVSGLHGKAGATSATIDFVRASGATGYLITAQNVSTRLFANQVITQRGTAVISGLAPDSDYQFQVYSISPGGVTASIDLFLKTASAN